MNLLYLLLLQTQANFMPLGFVSLRAKRITGSDIVAYGNINLYAGNDVNIVAQSIDITTAQNTGSRSSENSDLKIGQFARVTSPIIDLINNIDDARASDGRVKDMQIMAAAANAYQIAAAANSGAIFSAEVGTGFAVNRDSSEEQYSQVIASTIKGGAWRRDNVMVERLWRSVKYERAYLKAYGSVAHAKTIKTFNLAA